MEDLRYWTYINSPVGYLKLTSTKDELIAISFSEETGDSTGYQPEVLKITEKQLNEYFDGSRKEFDLKLNPGGTQFQLKIWELVRRVPFGKTASYIDIAREAGSLAKTRAVGMANGKNPIPIVIPCHRIIGKNGSLTGYAGGIERKLYLLQHEMKHSHSAETLF